jgi:XTP/dITP diphosphohydrolase
MKLIFATNNPHKLAEIKKAFESLSEFEIMSLADLGCQDDIPETADTLEGNALQKAQYVFERYALSCFADDTGLEIEALDGRPGVYSARYAGEGCSFDDNIDKVLMELEGVSNRKAEFRTVICLLYNGKEHYFEGRVRGTLLTERKGKKGFGYDPIFQPEGYSETFATMELEEKNQISHRGKAIRHLAQWLSKRQL